MGPRRLVGARAMLAAVPDGGMVDFANRVPSEAAKRGSVGRETLTGWMENEVRPQGRFASAGRSWLVRDGSRLCKKVRSNESSRDVSMGQERYRRRQGSFES